MITQYACNKPASWPLNIRFSAAKTRFTQSKFRMLHLLHCVVLVTFAREKKEREPLFKQTLKDTFHIITSLWVVFGLSTLISYFIIKSFSSINILFQNIFLCKVQIVEESLLHRKYSCLVCRFPLRVISPPSKELVESGILGFGIRSIHLKESGIQYLESWIHGVESGIPDCLGFPYMLQYLRFC